MVDNHDANNDKIATLEVYDATAGEALGALPIRRGEFNDALVYQPFQLSFNLNGRGGNTMEVRLYWNDKSYMRAEGLVVSTWP